MKPLVILTAVLLLGGCGLAEGFKEGVSAGLQPTATALTAGQLAFVQRARQIAPRVYGSDDHLLREAKSTCLDVKQEKGTATVVGNAVTRFSSGSYTVTTEEAAQLVQAAKDTVCRG